MELLFEMSLLNTHSLFFYLGKILWSILLKNIYFKHSKLLSFVKKCSKGLLICFPKPNFRLGTKNVKGTALLRMWLWNSLQAGYAVLWLPPRRSRAPWDRCGWGAPGRCMGSVTVDKCPLLSYFPSANTVGLTANWPLTCRSKSQPESKVYWKDPTWCLHGSW